MIKKKRKIRDKNNPLFFFFGDVLGVAGVDETLPKSWMKKQ